MKDGIFDIAVVGGGAAGVMASIRAGQMKKRVALVERNAAIGRKLLLTGKGRCNITNAAGLETFVEKFEPHGQFLRSAFFSFSNSDLIEFFRREGLALKTERQERVFPSDDKALSVIETLKRCMKKYGVTVLTGRRVKEIKKTDGHFMLVIPGERDIEAMKVIIATGGASYAQTGSTGDGYRFAERLGHTIVPLRPGLVPLVCKEPWVKDLQGLSLKNVRVACSAGHHKLVSDVGQMSFTHFGISGPLILDMSGRIVLLLKEHTCIRLTIDLKPGLEPEQVENRLLREFKEGGALQLKNLMKCLLPVRLVPVCLRCAGVDPHQQSSQITQHQRRVIAGILKALPLTVTGSLPIEEAMVTNGGVSTKEIDPRTMASRIVPGLYFAGEVIDGRAPSGGFNLQQAFSTGYCAGEQSSYA